MALSKERLGEIAMIALQAKLERNGDIRLNPKELKREAINSAKEVGITPQECAEFMKVVLGAAFNKSIAELDQIIAGGAKR